VGRPAGIYELTTDKEIKFQTDTATSRSPYYEQENSVNRTGAALTLFDEPDHWDSIAKKPFENKAKPPAYVTSSAHLVDYLVRVTEVRGAEVLYRAEIDMSWKFTDPNVIPPVETSVRFAGKADRLEPAHRRKLTEQFRNVNYLP
jgi:hypothetical protein